jgi:hypothetical protein
VHFQPGVNEELAATAVWGSQQTNLFAGARYDGVFAMWYGKGPGVDRSMDVLKHANAFGTSRYGGVLAVAGDDHACKSSTLPHQSEHNFIAASIPVLSPANVQEVLDLGIFGWELSRYSRLLGGPEGDHGEHGLGHLRGHRSGAYPDRDPRGLRAAGGGVHARWPDKPLEQEERLNKYKIYAAREFARVNGLNRVVLDSPQRPLRHHHLGQGLSRRDAGAGGHGHHAAVAAEIGLRVYKVGMPWPLEPQVTHDFAEGLEEILVVEEKRSIIEDQLTGQLYNYPVGSRPRVVGEFDEQGRDLLPNLGELTPAIVALAIAARIRRFYRPRPWSSGFAGSREGEVPGPSGGARGARAALLLRLSAQHLDAAARGQSRHGRHRLSLHGHLDAGPAHADLHADGRRGRDLDRPGAVHGHASRIPEPRRRHLLPLGDPGRARGGRRRCQHHLQDSLQRRGGHDRGAARRRFPDRAGAARKLDGEGVRASPWSAMTVALAWPAAGSATA